MIDNESTDASRRIAKGYLGHGVCRIETLPFIGYFDLVAQCRQQEQFAGEIDADWFIHHDADEIMQSPLGGSTLAESIVAVDAAGYNAINCDEFVFVPTSEDVHYENTDYVTGMRRYYFFEPIRMRLVRMWRRQPVVSLIDTGGHDAVFRARCVHPIPFVLRHYIGLSANHLRNKYSRRVYSQREVSDRNWHGWRAEFSKWDVVLPSVDRLKLYCGDGQWDKSEPKTEHQFIVRRRD